MAKEPNKNNQAASLQRRQLNGINNIVKSRRDPPSQAGAITRPHSNVNGKEVKSKSLQDRMTAPDTPKPAVNTSKEHSASPRKRKRQRNKQLDGDQVYEEGQILPAKRNVSDNKAGADTGATIRHGEPEAKKPRLWQHIKSKKFDASENASGSADKQPPKLTTVKPKFKETDEEDTKSLTPEPMRENRETTKRPSPPTKGPSPTSRKRGADVLKAMTEQKRKKVRPDVIEKATNKIVEKPASRKPVVSLQPVVSMQPVATLRTVTTLQPVDSATAKTRQMHAKPCAPVVTNPDCKHVYKEYGDNSIPILYAAYNSGDRPKALLTDPSLDLQCRALAVLESPKGFTANDLGRPNVKKTGRTKVIDDLDLYFMEEDHRIYVATECGLLLVADYLKLSGVPDTTPVRFNGTKPPYVRLSTIKRFFRWVSTTTYDPTVDERERAIIPEGDLPLLFGEMVEVWERDPLTGRVFGKCRHGGQTGWFDWENTVATRKELPPIEPWDETVFDDKDFKFSINDPPAPPAALASLRYVKTYRCWQAAAPPGTRPAATPTPTATPTPAGFTPSKFAKPPLSVQLSSSPKEEEAKQQARSGDSSTAATSPVGDLAKLEPIIEVPASPTDDEAKSMDFSSSSEAAESESGKVIDDLETDSGAISQREAVTLKEKAVTPISQKDEVTAQEVKKEESILSSTSSNKSSVQRSIHDHSVEDEVDWDDDEL